MKKLKVALIHNIVAPYRIPLFNELAKNPNLDLHVYFESKSEKNRDWIVNLDNSFKYKVLDGYTLNIGKQVYYHINPAIFKELFFGKYDIIISAGYSSFTNQIAFFISKLLRKPFILWSGSTENEPSLLRTLSSPLIKFIVRNSDSFIAYGTNAKKYLMKLGASEDKIFISFNTVDTEFFKKECAKIKGNQTALKQNLGINHKHIILYVGQLIERKGAKYLLHAHKKLADELDIGLVLVGSGNQKDELIKLCDEHKIKNVYFIDFVQRENMPQYYSIADVFVLPSLEEVWGLVINEAMACGLPVISTNKTGASKDLIEDNANGYIIPEKDSDYLYRSLNKIINNSALSEEMGKESNKIITERITINNATKGFQNAIHFVLKSD